VDENPFEAPATAELEAEGKVYDRAYLRRVAFEQKGILICLLLQILLTGAMFANLNTTLNLIIHFGLLGLVIATSIVGMVFIFRLALALYNLPIAILCGVLALPPCIGFLTLVFINSRATEFLKKEGVKVGLLGANLSKI
jgi:pilus assembly protein TadC